MKSFLVLGFSLAFGILSAISVQAQNTHTNLVARNPAATTALRSLDAGIVGVLTEPQRQSVAESLAAKDGKLREIHGKIREARAEMMTMTVSGRFDEAAVRSKAREIGNLEAEVAVIRMQALAHAQPPLNPEQVERLKRAIPNQRPVLRQPENRPGRQRILQGGPPRDANDLPPRR
ncbi:MAG TPA: hypothetical protein VEH04_20410 [Verrucomicrobiae bacterium]|nr:hypothetical protein [Verrucomicrobiae bacterium]